MKMESGTAVAGLGLFAFAASLMAVLLLAAGSVSSQDGGDCGDNLSWQFDDSGGSLVIQLKNPDAEGRMYDFLQSNTPWNKHTNDISSISLPSGLTNIGNYAFANCVSVTQLSFGEGLKTIGEHQFAKCGSDSALTEVVLPGTVEQIGRSAFESSYIAMSFEDIPASLKSVGDYAFNGCRMMKGALTAPDSLEYIGQNQFTGSGITSFAGGKGLRTIGDYAFSGIDSLTSLTFAEGISSIGRYAFFNDTQLGGTLSFPSSLSRIGDYAFVGCTLIDGIGFRNGLETVGPYAFSGCTGIRGSVSIPQTLTEIPPYMFNGCSGIDGDLSIADGVQKVGNHAFTGCQSLKTLSTGKGLLTIEGYAFTGCTSLASVNLANGLQVVEGYAFSGCSGLTGIVLPLTLTSIGQGAFLDCTQMKGPMLIPSSVLDIGISAFSGCSQINGELNLPQGLVYIGSSAFAGCTSLDAITLLPGIQKIEDSAFSPYTFLDENGKPITPRDADFDGYSYKKDAQGNMVRDSPVTVYPVEYHATGSTGDVPAQQPLQEGQAFSVQDFQGTKSGYVFIGWTAGGTLYKPLDVVTMGNQQIVFEATWARTHTVTYDTNGGSGPVPQTQTVAEGEVFTLQDYSGTKSGCMFIGWTYNGLQYLPGTAMTMDRFDIDFEAIWTSKYHVTYNANGGTGDVPTQEDVWMGQHFTVQDYSGTKEGCIFDGWSYMGRIYYAGDSVLMGDRDIMLIAHWLVAHTVEYDLNGGTGDAPHQDPVAETRSFTVQGCTAVRQGYKFSGWIWDYDGNLYYEGDTITVIFSDIRLTAFWEISRDHYVFYDVNGGSAIAPGPIYVGQGEQYTVDFSPGTKHRYEFRGWSDGKDTYSIGDTITMNDKNIILVAMWAVKDPLQNQGFMLFGAVVAAFLIGLMVYLGRDKYHRGDRPYEPEK